MNFLILVVTHFYVFSDTDEVEANISNPEVIKTRVITVPEGYDPKAAEILFGYVKGLDVLLQYIQDYKLLEDVLRLCDYYEILSPLEALVSHMHKNMPINMTNVIKVLIRNENNHLCVRRERFSKCTFDIL